MTTPVHSHFIYIYICLSIIQTLELAWWERYALLITEIIKLSPANWEIPHITIYYPACKTGICKMTGTWGGGAVYRNRT
jgi:hypothetical protein